MLHLRGAQAQHPVTVREITAILVSWNDTDDRWAAVSTARDWSESKASPWGSPNVTIDDNREP